MQIRGYIWGLATAIVLSVGLAFAATQTLPYMQGTVPLTAGNCVKIGTDGLSIADSGGACSAAAATFRTPLTWGPGQNLTTPSAIPILTVLAASTITAVTCRPEVLAGGVATITVVKSATGTALNPGTAVTSTTCNANTGAGANQSLTISAGALNANDTVGIIATGGGWSSPGNGAGVIQINWTQP